MTIVLPPPERKFPSKIYLWLCKIQKNCAEWEWVGDNTLAIDELSADELFEIA